jgi:hypothetical protein
MDNRIVGSWIQTFKSERFDEGNMLMTITLVDEDEQEERHVLPAKFDVCPVCNGKGKHVNPSVDSHGLTSEDFAEDPEFAKDYFGGMYDVTCYSCNGKRVVPEVDLEALSNEQLNVYEKYCEQLRDDIEYEQSRAEERMRGA